MKSVCAGYVVKKWVLGFEIHKAMSVKHFGLLVTEEM
jgi:hypothetical protein